jgi:predicted phage terminase large subunit-like protein
MPLHLSESQKQDIKARIQSGALKPDAPEVKQLLVAMHDEDVLLFASKFLADHMKLQGTTSQLTSPPFHEELISYYKNNKRVALAAPRNHAKSTVTTFFYVLHCALYQKKKNIVIISATEDMAKRFLRRIRDELEYNKRIIFAFGNQVSNKWAETEIKLSNGVSIHAKGREAQLRGLIDGANRPDLLIFDDIEDDELMRSQLRRQDLEEWFNGAALPSLDPHTGQAIVVGTILHEDSLLNRLLNQSIYPEFVSHRFSAIYQDKDNETKSLWPERFPLETLEKLKASYIARGKLPQFYMEYLNNPIPEETAKFKREYFRFFDDLPSIQEEQIYFECFIDLGGGSAKETADYTAMVVLAIDRHNNIYIHDYVNKRTGSDINAIIDALLSLHHKYRPRRFVFEKTVATNMIQAALNQSLISKNVHLNIEYINPTRGSGDRRGNMSDGKYQRIVGMEGAFKLGVIKMRPWMTELQDQLLAFPRASHDDLIDALAYGYQLLSRRNFYAETLNQETEEYIPLYEDIGL